MNNDQLEVLLSRVYDGVREGLREQLDPEEYERRRREFIFHMSDWKSDLHLLTELFNNPHGQVETESTEFLIGFLYHVIPHLNAAGRLLLDEIADPFASVSEERTTATNAENGNQIPVSEVF